jgi:hypothetical protein
MQDSRLIVSAMSQHIPQRVLSEPVSVPWVAIRKTVNATAYCHDPKIHLAVRECRVPRILFIRLLDGSAVLDSDPSGASESGFKLHVRIAHPLRTPPPEFRTRNSVSVCWCDFTAAIHVSSGRASTLAG